MRLMGYTLDVQSGNVSCDNTWGQISQTGGLGGILVTIPTQQPIFHGMVNEVTLEFTQN